MVSTHDRVWAELAARGIEIGLIFQLGRKYTNAFEPDVLGPDDKSTRVTMGSYGIGIPAIFVVGSGLANGVVEVKDRATGGRQEAAVDDAAAHLRALVIG